MALLKTRIFRVAEPARKDLPPLYEPHLWNDEALIKSVNCLGYALNVKTWLRLGDMAFQSRGAAIGATIERSMRLYDLKPAPFQNPPNKEGYYLVALTWGRDTADWHWMRQDAGGAWSHKLGSKPVTNRDDKNRLIADPRKAILKNHKEVIAYFYKENRRLQD